MASPSRMLVAAVAAALVAVAWCAPVPLSFTVQNGSDEKKLALEIRFNVDRPLENNDFIQEVELKQKEQWVPLTRAGGLVWEVKSDKPLKGPFTFRYQSGNGMTAVFDNVVPADFKVGTTYTPPKV